MNKRVIGTMAVMVPMIAWGISFVNTKVLLEVLGPMTIGALRFTMATALMFLVARLQGKNEKIEKRDHFNFFLIGAVGIGFYFYFENWAIALLPPSIVSIVLAAIPIITLVAESVIYKRPITRRNGFLFTTSLVGIVVITGFDIEELMSSGEALGYVLIILAVISWVMYSMFSKPVLGKYSYITIIKYQFLYGTLVFLPFLFFENNNWSVITASHITHILFLGIFASVLGFLCYSVAMGYLGISEASIFINFMPIVTILFSYVYLGDLVTLEQILGSLMIILSASLVKPQNEQVLEPEFQ